MVEVVRGGHVARVPVAKNVIKSIEYGVPTTQPTTRPVEYVATVAKPSIPIAPLSPPPIPPRKTLREQRFAAIKEELELQLLGMRVPRFVPREWEPPIFVLPPVEPVPRVAPQPRPVLPPPLMIGPEKHWISEVSDDG